MKLRKLLSFLLLVVMTISLLPTVTYAADAVSYLYWDDTEKELVSAQCTDYTVVTSTTGTLTQPNDDASFERYVWEPGWYVVNSNVTIDRFVQIARTTLDDKVHLILCDGATLTLPGICYLDCGLSIYGQNEGSGKLDVIGETHIDFEIDIGNTISTNDLTVNGGTVTVTDGPLCTQRNMTVNGGTVTATNSSLLAINLTVNDGKIQVKNDNAYIPDYTYAYGSYAITVLGLLTMNGGEINATGRTLGSEEQPLAYGESGGIKVYKDKSSYNDYNRPTVFGIVVNGGKVTASGGAVYSTHKNIEHNGTVLFEQYAYICSAGILLKDGDLTVSGNAAVTATSGKVSVADEHYNIVSAGIGCENGSSITVKNNAKLTAKSEGAKGRYSDSYGISLYDGGNLTVQNSGVVSAECNAITNTDVSKTADINLDSGTINSDAHTATFHLNYASKPSTHKTTVLGTDGRLTEPVAPERIGYEFDGWFTKSVGGDEATFDTTLDSNIDIYAHWAPIPAVAPTVTPSANTEVTYGRYTNEEISVSVIPQDGYAYTYQWYDDSENIISGATESNYTIPNDLAVGSYDYSCVVTAKRNDNGETATIEKKINVKVNKAPTASNSTIRYTVKFNTNGGNTIASQRVTKNDTATKPSNPTKDGFVFDGWYADSKFTNEYDFNRKVTAPITLYAKWTETKNENTDDSKDDVEKPSANEFKNPFTDVKENDWFFDSVKFVNEYNLMNGTTITTFAPNDNLTRGMLVTILYRMEGEPAVNRGIPFSDVTANSYYANAVNWAHQNGIVVGVSENEFAPDENITREQFATIICRYAKFKGYDVSVGEDTNILSYTDFDEISDYAIEPLQYAAGSGLMKGKTASTLNPKDNTTRAETSAILQRFIEGN